MLLTRWWQAMDAGGGYRLALETHKEKRGELGPYLAIFEGKKTRAINFSRLGIA